MTRKKKIILWTAIPALLLLIMATAVILLAPRVINLDAVKNSIESSVSREMGGTLTYERADIVFFPRPGVAVRNMQISVPGALAGSIGTLKIYPSILPLFLRRFEISRIETDQLAIMLELSKGSEKDEQEPAPESVQQTIGSVLTIAAHRMPDITIIVNAGSVTTRQEGKTIRSFREISGKLAFLADRPADGSLAPGSMPSQPAFLLIGKASCRIVDNELLPEPISLSIGRFEARPRSLTVINARARISDLAASFSGTIDGYLTTIRKAKLSLDASVGSNVINWIRDTVLLPPELTIHAPLTISHTTLHWRNNGSMSLKGNASVPGGTTLTFDLAHDIDSLRIRELKIHDRESNAVLTLSSGQQVLDIGFKGNLTQKTLNRLFEHESFRFGWIKGNFHALVRYDDPMQSTAEGSLIGEDLVIPFVLKVPFTIDTLSLRAEGQRIVIDPALLSIKKSMVAAQGTIAIQDSGLLLDLDLSTDGMEWDALRELLAPYASESQKPIPLKVLGAIKLRAGYLATEHYQVQSVDADVALEQDLVKLHLRKASVCGISLPGMVTITPSETQIDLQPSATGPDLTADLSCITGGRVKISGSYVLLGRLNARGVKNDLLKTLKGTLTLTAKNGKVFHDFVFIRTIAYLNVSDLLKGSYDNIERDGAPFDSFTTRADIKNGAMTFKETMLKSNVMNIVGNGVIDLPGWTIDVTLLAAPFTTVDAVVKRIPLIGEILGGSLISIPIRIHGPLDNPTVTTLPASSIGEGLLGMMKRTLTLPFTIIEPILPKGKHSESEQTK